VLVGIGAHHLETLHGCVAAGMTPDFWMKTMHHHEYWSARHPEWHDNVYCNTPAETAAWMRERKEPWIAFKTMAAGAIHPKDAFRYAWESGADFVCAGMYDFQMVEDVNIALEALSTGLPQRRRAWMASPAGDGGRRTSPGRPRAGRVVRLLLDVHFLGDHLAVLLGIRDHHRVLLGDETRR